MEEEKIEIPQILDESENHKKKTVRIVYVLDQLSHWRLLNNDSAPKSEIS
jgi:hypothetical protein